MHFHLQVQRPTKRNTRALGAATCSRRSSRQPRSDQALPLLQTDDSHFGKLGHVRVQLLLQILWKRHRMVNELERRRQPTSYYRKPTTFQKKKKRKRKKNKNNPVGTFGAEVVHQDDLLDEVRRRPVEHAVHRAQQRGPNLIHEAEDHAGGGQVIMDQGLGTPGGQVRRRRRRATKWLREMQKRRGIKRMKGLTCRAWCPGALGQWGSCRSGRR